MARCKNIQLYYNDENIISFKKIFFFVLHLFIKYKFGFKEANLQFA